MKTPKQAYDIAWYRARVSGRRAAGECTRCGAKLPDGHAGTQCSPCRESKRALNKRRPKQPIGRPLAGTAPVGRSHECARCTEPHAPGSELCHDCGRLQVQLKQEGWI
mgnify:CR=1 FL=1